MGEIAVAVDCSGSVSARQLGLFQEEIRSILAGQRPRLVHVLYFDAAVQKVETYQAGEPISLVPVGGGGTDFRPCFDWLRERGIVPADVGVPHRSLRHVSERSTAVSGNLGFDRESAGAIRAGCFDGGSLNRPFRQANARAKPEDPDGGR